MRTSRNRELDVLQVTPSRCRYAVSMRASRNREPDGACLARTWVAAGDVNEQFLPAGVQMNRDGETTLLVGDRAGAPRLRANAQ